MSISVAVQFRDDAAQMLVDAVRFGADANRVRMFSDNYQAWCSQVRAMAGRVVVL